MAVRAAGERRVERLWGEASGVIGKRAWELRLHGEVFRKTYERNKTGAETSESDV